MRANLTLIGRFVQGSLTLEKKKDEKGQPALDKDGVQIEECFIALAVPKTDPALPGYYAAYVEAARAAFPSLVDAAGNISHPRFAMKIQDGDGIDKNGKSVKDKPGFAGCYVFKMATRYAPRCYVKDAHGNNQLLEDPSKIIRKGYRIAVAVGIDGNGVSPQGNGSAVPGLYVSPDLVLLVAPDTEIVSGPDPTAAFAGITSTMPEGVAAPAGLALPNAAPGGLTPPALPGITPQQPAAGLPGLPGMPAAGSGLPPLPGAAPAATGMPPLPGAGTPPLPPSGPVYTMQPSAMGASRDDMHKLGWTDEAMIAQGHMVKTG